MEIRSDKSTTVKKRPVSFWVGWMTMLAKFMWLIGFFRLTKEERLVAGICLHGEKQDE